jgi:hypothetical protein
MCFAFILADPLFLLLIIFYPKPSLAEASVRAASRAGKK